MRQARRRRAMRGCPTGTTLALAAAVFLLVCCISRVSAPSTPPVENINENTNKKKNEINVSVVAPSELGGLAAVMSRGHQEVGFPAPTSPLKGGLRRVGPSPSFEEAMTGSATDLEAIWSLISSAEPLALYKYKGRAEGVRKVTPARACARVSGYNPHAYLRGREVCLALPAAACLPALPAACLPACP